MCIDLKKNANCNTLFTHWMCMEGRDLVRMAYLERKDVEPLEARSHAQNLLPVVSIIEVPFLRGMAHTSRIPSNNIEICTSINTSLSMPLHLSWPSIMH